MKALPSVAVAGCCCCCCLHNVNDAAPAGKAKNGENPGGWLDGRSAKGGNSFQARYQKQKSIEEQELSLVTYVCTMASSPHDLNPPAG